MTRRALSADFEEFLACLNRHGVDYLIVGSDALLKNKLAAARPKDLADVAALGRVPRSRAD